jgi:hypothetical protein
MSDSKITRRQFYFETPLYEPLEISNCEDLFKGEFDALRTDGSSETTYTIETEPASADYLSDFRSRIGGFAQITLTCKRTGTQDLVVFVYVGVEEQLCAKVGQLPSLADTQFGELGKKYDKLMDRKDLKEFKKAIGLAAHGTGIGSFVYLRRIFENLIEEAYQNNKSALSINEDEFRKKRMADKVASLAEYLPSQLVQMKGLYSILSKGVHELDEHECLAYFDGAKLAIELILDQKIEQDLKKQRDEAVRKQLVAIEAKLQSAPESRSI